MINEIGYLVIIPLPIIIYFFWEIIKTHNFTLFLICTIITLTFVQGSLELMDIITAKQNILVQDLIIYFLFFIVVIKNVVIKKEGRFPFLLYVVMYVTISILSYSLNNVELFSMLMFFRWTLLSIIVFYIFFNIVFSESNYDLIKNYFILLFVSQLVVAIIKFCMIGITEPYIGTMSYRSGSLTTCFSLMGISYAFTMYLYKKNLIYLIYILGFILFSIIGGKRATVFYIPLLLFVLYCAYNNMLLSKGFLEFKFVKPFLSIIILIIGLSYLYITLTPSLNPEGKTGGSIDLNYVGNFLESYNFNKRGRYADYYGRGDAPGAVLRLIRKEEKILLGFGAGDLVPNRYNNPHGLRLADFIGIKYNIGYGARTGVLWMILQVGILGTSLYLLFYVLLFNQLRKRIKYYNDNDNKILGIILIGIFVIFILDYFTYSTVMIKSRQVVYPFMFFLSCYLKGEINNYKML